MYETLIFAFCAFLCAWALSLTYSRRARKLLAGLPGYLQLPILGNLLKVTGGSEAIFKIMLDICKKMEEHRKPLVFWFGPLPVVVVSDPEDVKIVATTFAEKPYFYTFARIWVGNGLVTAPGSIWKRNIKKLAGTFTGSVVNGYQEVFNAQARKLSAQLKGEVESAPFNIRQKYLAYTTLETIMQTALGVSRMSESMVTPEYYHAFTRTFELLIQRGVNPLFYPDWVYQLTPMYRELVKCVAVLHNVSNTVIAKRRKEFDEMKQKETNPDQTLENGRVKFQSFLDILLELRESDPSIEEDWIRSEVDTIIVGGQETVATALLFVILMIGSKPEIQDKLYAEMKSIFGDSKRSVQKEDLARMTYCEAIISETLRLYPPAPGVMRDADQDCKLRDCTIPKGTMCVVNAFGAGRSQHTWGPDAAEFKPERWLEGHTPQSAAFLAFSYGKRSCIGKRYAMALLKTVLAWCVRDVTFVSTADELRLKVDVVLRPISGHHVQVRLRQ